MTKVRVKLVGLDSNAFVLMAAFGDAARKQGWTREEINVVLDECKKGSYDDLLVTLMANTEDPDEEELDEEEDDDDIDEDADFDEEEEELEEEDEDDE